MNKLDQKKCEKCGKQFYYSGHSWNYKYCKPCKKEINIKETNEYNNTIFKEYNTKHNNITIYKSKSVIISQKNDYWISIHLDEKELNELIKEYNKLKDVNNQK